MEDSERSESREDHYGTATRKRYAPLSLMPLVRSKLLGNLAGNKLDWATSHIGSNRKKSGACATRASEQDHHSPIACRAEAVQTNGCEIES